jgi:hypothetical protein
VKNLTTYVGVDAHKKELFIESIPSSPFHQGLLEAVRSMQRKRYLRRIRS